MNSTIAHTYVFNIIIIFMFIVFAFMMGMLVYYKSFKINKQMLSLIEKYEGYNEYSKREIDETLSIIGYSFDGPNCRQRTGTTVYAGSTNSYCVYYYGLEQENQRYYTYGVTTYITFDLPFNIDIKLPIHTKSNRIFKFNDNHSAPAPGSLEG